MDYRYPQYLTLDSAWFHRALAVMFRELEAYLEKWAAFAEAMGE
jgi:hypothetical protein